MGSGRMVDDWFHLPACTSTDLILLMPFFDHDEGFTVPHIFVVSPIASMPGWIGKAICERCYAQNFGSRVFFIGSEHQTFGNFKNPYHLIPIPTEDLQAVYTNVALLDADRRIPDSWYDSPD